MNDYDLEGQMTIFDYLQPEHPKESIEERELLKGSGFREGKTRIYNFFIKEHTEKEKVSFLKKEYGVGGWSMPEGFCGHDAEGIYFEKYINPQDKTFKKWDKTVIPWNIVQKRITELINQGKYRPTTVTVDVRGICDDGYCPVCNIWLDNLIERCPECSSLLDWSHWKILNKEYL